MILRRLALFFALLLGLATTQLPEFVAQYRQRLGGAIDELSNIVAGFDRRNAEAGLSESAAISRFRASPDPLVRQEGDEKAETIARLANLRDAQKEFQDAAPVARLATFVRHYDPRVAAGTWHDFEPAVPTSGEALILGGLGFLVGGGTVHALAYPLRRQRRGRRRLTPA